MDKRTLLALAMMAIVLVVTPMFFKQPPRVEPVIDSAAAPAATTPTTPAPAAGVQAPGIAPSPTIGADTTQRVTSAVSQPRTTTTLATGKSEVVLVNPGASPSIVKVPAFRDLTPKTPRDAIVTIRSGNNPLLRYRLARGADTIALDTVAFTVTQSGAATTFASPIISLTYQPSADGLRTEVRGTAPGAPAGSSLIIDLPTTINSVEADSIDDMRHLAYGFRRPRRPVESIPFSKLDSLETRVDTGGMQWVVARNKYWLVALMKPVGGDSTAAFHTLVTRGGSFVGKIENVAHGTTSHPLANGTVAFDLYVGPQSWELLRSFGNDLENVNPYAGFMHSVVQPFATIVMRVLLWMKATFRVNYGWVLVIFGVAIRLLMWPLNQKAMRTSIQMQRIQPELQEIQKKYKSDPEKQREALVKLYASHGMSPLSPMLGCLPMLLPMPVLFALYFVFQNTIEFRDVQFLWLPDISLKDPFYIIPLLMGVSMFVLSWIGMRGMPPNPQAKMMSYMMPVMFTFFFLNVASGLNLYYAVQNIAGLPQQWLLTRERARATGTANATPKKKT
jgi:YidC/Oxa1 family membrane protein insertase